MIVQVNAIKRWACRFPYTFFRTCPYTVPKCIFLLKAWFYCIAHNYVGLQITHGLTFTKVVWACLFLNTTFGLLTPGLLPSGSLENPFWLQLEISSLPSLLFWLQSSSQIISTKHHHEKHLANPKSGKSGLLNSYGCAHMSQFILACMVGWSVCRTLMAHLHHLLGYC